MLSVSAQCFVLIPNTQNSRVLHPGKVLSVAGNLTGAAVVQFEEDPGLAPDAEVVLCAEWKGKFHQQGARVKSIAPPTVATAGTASAANEAPASAANDKLTIEFQRSGEPVNCESRGIYRVSVATQEVRITVGKQLNCLLTDVSAEGISAIVNQPLKVGSTVEINISVESIFAQGVVRVQSEKQLAGGKLRYGFHAPEKKSQLRRSLESISNLMQRRQLRRMSGVAA